MADVVDNDLEKVSAESSRIREKGNAMQLGLRFSLFSVFTVEITQNHAMQFDSSKPHQAGQA